MLVLHGFLEQGAAWQRFATALAGRVVAPDHRGHGRSDHVGPGGFYHFWDYVADVDGLVRRLGGDVDLLGHSMGGTIATLYAAIRPERVRRLVLVEGLGLPDLAHEQAARADAFLRAREAPPRHGVFRDVAEAAQRLRRASPSLPQEEAERLAARITRPTLPDDPHAERHEPGWLTWRWDPLHRARNPVPFRAAVHEDFLSRVTAPTLLVEGGASTWQVPDRSRRAAFLRTAHTEVIPTAGHLVHHDAPDQLAALVHTFLET